MTELNQQMSSDADGWLSDEEIESLIFALLETRRGRGATQDEMKQVVKWATALRISEAMLRVVLKGRVLIDVDQQGEIILIARDQLNEGDS